MSIFIKFDICRRENKIFSRGQATKTEKIGQLKYNFSLSAPIYRDGFKKSELPE